MLRHLAQLFEPLPDRHLRDDVLPVVLDEQAPLVRVVLRQIPHPSAVGLSRLAGLAEVVDERLAGLCLLLILRQP